ncbi:uncharacterized protein BBA_10002 [Beauveria bassiana ARSEF 2860]|uniref:Uncharacterized protein n=1 Tax=Beauveria bassiana (strain ARSEF 2860) TaxID=655819 RepID=J5J2H1_BEAB2|nr:uncharacterized protein BBA_10002 [Beauveria bassiana ARSEF 2860]EJP61043.1 hypothetical protein BBA_10002 [Beauveria bassiana ARSEF 2860]
MDAQEYLQQVSSLFNSFDAEVLLRAGNVPVGSALEAVNRLRCELEILDLLRPALTALSPDFTTFEPHILVRLRRFLVYVFGTRNDPKTEAIRKLDCTSVKICGLCLTQKGLRDLKLEQLDVLIRRTEVASRHLLHVIAGNDDIDKVVRLCNVEGDEYEQFFNGKDPKPMSAIQLRNLDHKKVRRVGKGSTQLAVQYSLAGQGCWCFTGVSQKAIHASFAIPTTSAVRDITTFLPVDERYDGIMRMTVGFDTELLRTLFGHQLPQPIVSEPFALERAIKSQIGAVLGSTVVRGVTTTHTWAKEIQDGLAIETSCVSGHIYPGSCIIVTLRIGWRESPFRQDAYARWDFDLSTTVGIPYSYALLIFE